MQNLHIQGRFLAVSSQFNPFRWPETASQRRKERDIEVTCTSAKTDFAIARKDEERGES